MSEPEKRLNRPARIGFQSLTGASSLTGVPRVRWSQPLAIGLIILAWIVQFLSFSLERLLHDPETESLTRIGTRAVVTVIGIFISLAILKILRRCAGMAFVKRALIAFGLALGGSILHSILNDWVFLITLGPSAPGNEFSVESFAALVYLFGWVYLAVTILLLSLTYGEELLNGERRIAELASEADLAQRAHANTQDRAFLWLQKAGGKVRVDVSSIDWVAAEGEYVRFHCGAESYLERQSISAIEEELAPLGFVRIHRSAIVNADRIERLMRTRSGALHAFLSTGTELRVSKSFQPSIRQLVQARI